MTLDAAEVRSFPFGHGYVAPVGTAFPDEIDDPVDLDLWAELGHLSEAGPRFSFGKNLTPQASWQSRGRPVRNLRGAQPITVSFDLLQWNRNNTVYALGDSGSWAESSPGSGLWTYTPGSEGDVDERALIVEAVDGDFNYRFCFARTENQAGVDFAWTGTALAPLPIVATVLEAPNEGAPYIIQSDDPNIEEEGS